MFRAKLLNYPWPDSKAGDNLKGIFKDRITLFSRTKVIQHFDRTTGKPYPPNEPYPNRILGSYHFDKIRNDRDKFVFKATIEGKAFELKMNWRNRFLCNWMHNRYLINKDGGEWFIKTLIAAAIGALFGLIGTIVGYRQGHQNGLKEGQALRQDTTQKR